MSDLPAPIERFIMAVETRDWDGFVALLADDVVLDATVPEWRYQLEGPAVAEELRSWTAGHPWQVTEHRFSPTPDGGVLELQLHGDCPGDGDHTPHEEMSRQAAVFTLRDGLVVEFRLYCAGEWNEEVIARIAADAPKMSRNRVG